MNRNKLFYSIVYTVLILLLIVVLYPLIYIVSASFSSPNAVSTGKVILFPVDFSLEGYKEVMKYSDVWIGYRNTILYTVAGTVLNVVLTMLTGFGLSRKGLPGRKFITFLFTFTMLFSGGLVPTYLVMNRLNLINTPFAMIFPGAINITNMIIARTFISSIPDDLEEAAMIDGCSHARYFFEMVVPLSKAIIAVLYAVLCGWPLERILQRADLSKQQSVIPTAAVSAGDTCPEYGGRRHNYGSGAGRKNEGYGRTAEICFDRSLNSSYFVCLPICPEVFYQRRYGRITQRLKPKTV